MKTLVVLVLTLVMVQSADAFPARVKMQVEQVQKLGDGAYKYTMLTSGCAANNDWEILTVYDENMYSPGDWVVVALFLCVEKGLDGQILTIEKAWVIGKYDLPGSR